MSPCTVCFHVVLCNHIESILIAQIINTNIIRIMAGSYRIDIILFHRYNVLNNIFCRDSSSCFGAELMSVHTLKNNPLPIDVHNISYNLKFPKADILYDFFLLSTLCTRYTDRQLIKIRFLRTPQLWVFHRKYIGIFLINLHFC